MYNLLSFIQSLNYCSDIVFFSEANFVSILAKTTTFLAFHVMLSSSRNQQLHPTGIVPYPISYTMTKKVKKAKTDGRLFLVFYVYHRKRREEYFWFVCAVGRAFTLVCLWGDYNLNAASLEAFSHSSFSVPRTKLVIFVLLKFGKKFNREISHFNLSSKDLDKCELNWNRFSS